MMMSSSFPTSASSSSPLHDALEDSSQCLAEAIEKQTNGGTSTKPSAEADPPALDDNVDPAIAAFMAAQKPPKLEFRHWARLILKLQDTVEMHHQAAEVTPPSSKVEDLLQTFRSGITR
jgi:hypothetical protein